MSASSEARQRRSLFDLQEDYERGNTAELDNLMRAWAEIKALPPDDERSFFVLGGYHGEPFRGAGWDNATYWGGYCQHGNVLFPVWHRIYLYKLEEALRTVPGCENVTLPFWDECGQDSRIPWALTNQTYWLGGPGGSEIPNPLRSYTFPVNVVDHIDGDSPNYGKHAGYETVRYPYSGLVGTAEDQEQTKKHNAQWTYCEAVDVLNKNVWEWRTQEITIRGKVITYGIDKAYRDCLSAPNYTLFSNTTSAANANDNAKQLVTPLENPHNKMHLAVGGYDAGTYHASLISGANGDMGENDTAGLDPIFYFHHCFVDRVFWLWQKRNRATDDLEVLADYPGTSSGNGQGSSPGIPPNTPLNMDTPLEPFKLADRSRFYTGRDAFNIESQLGYSYGPGSLDEFAEPTPAPADLASAAAEQAIHVTGVNRSAINGSFVINAFITVDGERKLIGTEAVLSRWHVGGCANCQTHLLAGAAFPTHGLLDGQADPGSVEVEVRTHGGLLGNRSFGLADQAEEQAQAGEPASNVRVEVR